MESTDAPVLFSSLEKMDSETDYSVILAPCALAAETVHSDSLLHQLDTYVFHGCHMSGSDYKWELDHYDMCITPRLITPTIPASLLTRSQSEPDLNAPFHQGLGSTAPHKAVDVACLTRSFSFTELQIDETGELAQCSIAASCVPSLVVDDLHNLSCPICYTPDEVHHFQHNLSDYEAHEAFIKSLGLPDSISSESSEREKTSVTTEPNSVVYDI